VSQLNPQNINTKAREAALQFLYQCEAEHIFHFSESHFKAFANYFEIPDAAKARAIALSEGYFNHQTLIDQVITDHAKNWKLPRMAATDRAVLRIATYEILEQSTPHKVILNEAIELAKNYGTEHSGSFVNGILDALSKSPSKPQLPAT